MRNHVLFEREKGKIYIYIGSNKKNELCGKTHSSKEKQFHRALENINCFFSVGAKLFGAFVKLRKILFDIFFLLNFYCCCCDVNEKLISNVRSDTLSLCQQI
jgi:hypothetical protein